ncbi:hypothetical protein HMPREF1991_01881 [Hoylesella loescheii DSM 19665 = JCM 12249 = ATCC 15930]|uniref:Uncharacterized protein n=1 Tax=Hoylesella loescheii DSM 19665 = JCM 12249 = ATCC 15930 TaxID=1122985 RepID=A0A069QH60_HOYLO|nr:hypothetical protein HMPREF1991_01881 [Hoylesella loescheii DSM 19665 = JCM 12249 = ATCC 15930]
MLCRACLRVACDFKRWEQVALTHVQEVTNLQLEKQSCALVSASST